MSIIEAIAREEIKKLAFANTPCAEPIIDLLNTEGSILPAERRESLIESARDAERHQRVRIKQRAVILDRRMA